MKELILVADSDLGALSVDAVHQEPYGELKAKLCSSEEEAIKYVQINA